LALIGQTLVLCQRTDQFQDQRDIGRGRTANGDGHDESYIVSTILNSLASLPSHVSRLTSFDSYTLTAACSHPTNSTTATTLPQRGQLRHNCAALPTDANATRTTSGNTAARSGAGDAGTAASAAPARHKAPPR